MGRGRRPAAAPDGRGGPRTGPRNRRPSGAWVLGAGRRLRRLSGRSGRSKGSLRAGARGGLALAAPADGQVLPIAALSQRLELLHASAVALDGRIFAFTGAGGAGKSTLAARLILAGASFISDDVLAVERVDDQVIAHPGPALMNLRESPVPVLNARERSRLG